MKGEYENPIFGAKIQIESFEIKGHFQNYWVQSTVWLVLGAKIQIVKM